MEYLIVITLHYSGLSLLLNQTYAELMYNLKVEGEIRKNYIILIMQALSNKLFEIFFTTICKLIFKYS